MKTVSKLLFLLSLSFSLYAEINTTMILENMKNNTKITLESEEKKRYVQHLKNKNTTFMRIDLLLKQFPEYEHTIKSRFPKLLEDYKEVTKGESEVKVLFHFISTSVPPVSVSNVLVETTLLQQKFPIEIRHIVLGLDSSIKEYLPKLFSLTESYQTLTDRLRENLIINIDSKAFRFLNLKKVPALAWATCKESSIYPSDCKIEYLIRGDVGLLTFFDKLSIQEESFIPYYNLLASEIE